MRQFDWPTIRAAYERGLTPTEIATTLPDCPTRQAVEKRAKKEGWMVARLPDQTPATQLIGKDATRAVVIENVRSGVPLTLAAGAAGIDPKTLYNWRQDNPEFADALQAARSAFLARKIKQIDEAGERDWNAAKYLVERAPETRDEFGQSKSESGLVIVLQIDRSENPKGATIEHDDAAR